MFIASNNLADTPFPFKGKGHFKSGVPTPKRFNLHYINSVLALEFLTLKTGDLQNI